MLWRVHLHFSSVSRNLLIHEIWLPLLLQAWPWGLTDTRRTCGPSFFGFLIARQVFFQCFHSCSESLEWSEPKLDSPCHRAIHSDPLDFLKAFRRGSIAIKKKVLLSKNKNTLGQVESVWKTALCYTLIYWKKWSLELVAREHTLVVTEQRKCSWFVLSVRLVRHLPPFNGRLILSCLLRLHAPRSARQEIPKAGRENKQELLK